MNGNNHKHTQWCTNDPTNNAVDPRRVELPQMSQTINIQIPKDTGRGSGVANIFNSCP